MTYNLRGLRHGVDRVAEAIGGQSPDVLLVQESGPRRAFRRLAERLGMRGTSDPWSPFRRRIQNAILIRPPLAIESSRLHRLSRSELWYPRGALVARVVGPGLSIWCVSVHLGMRPRDRRRHGVELERLCGALGSPVVMGGDLNEGPDGAAASRIGRFMVDAWTTAGSGIGETIYSWDRKLRIDYVFVSTGIETDACRVPSEPGVVAASDHLPVVADVCLADGEEA
ncbi:MAG: endonuclease/exonuclease/phosphatase family protein [Actinomycetota bacterium]